ncbi:MAG: hypothetical protein OXC81_07565, partial [Betaproteobacteria bacterium]|nr:hypothetical protein [Betaproteobacteria bacterium]
DARKIGSQTCLRTSQMVGYLSIGAGTNPDLRDTSSRERLADCPATAQFRAAISAIVALLEKQRSRDWRHSARQKTFTEMFREIDTAGLVAQVTRQQQQGASSQQIVESVHNYAGSFRHSCAMPKRAGRRGRKSRAGCSTIVVWLRWAPWFLPSSMK